MDWTSVTVNSFSTNPISICGTLKLPIKFTRNAYTNHYNLQTLVTDSKKYFFPFILGLDFILRCKVNLETTPIFHGVRLEAKLSKTYKMKAILENPKNIFNPMIRVENLEPRRLTTHIFELPIGTPVVAKDLVYITPIHMTSLFVFPSVSPVYREGNSPHWQCHVAVINLSTEPINRISTVSLEILDRNANIIQFKNKT